MTFLFQIKDVVVSPNFSLYGYNIMLFTCLHNTLSRALLLNTSFGAMFCYSYRCSEYQTSSLKSPNIHFDGILGFGQGALSIISQLFAKKAGSTGVFPLSRGWTDWRRDDGFRSHCNVYLRRIAINGQLLPIESAIFTPGHDQETFVDSGTIYVHFVEDAFYPLINSVSPCMYS